jgi:tetratricopeptide (TPR) repeat protein
MNEAATDNPPPFLDVPELLELSQPRRAIAWFWYAVGGFLLAAMLSSYFSTRSPGAEMLVRLFSSVTLFGLMVGMMLLTALAVRRHRNEQRQLESIEELVQLRRWPEAGLMLQQMLSRPTRTPQSRVQALIYLTSVLARYHRFNDVIAVQNHLLEHVRLDPGAEYGMRLGRAMAMLREDHLFDADGALSELRRSPAGGESGGLALLEIYRDVKTGHPEEAIEIFQARLPTLRQHLGHRISDAYALVARAYDLLGRVTEANVAWRKATLLAPAEELQRRYPEVRALSEKYEPAAAPAGVA